MLRLPPIYCQNFPPHIEFDDNAHLYVPCDNIERYADLRLTNRRPLNVAFS